MTTSLGNLVRPRLLVLSSTYPRWSGDSEPGFVHELSRRLTDEFDVVVVAPRAPRALKVEILDGVQVHRFGYAPENWQSLVNGGGITSNLRENTWKYFLLPGFMLGMVLTTRAAIKRHRPDLIHAHWLLPQGLLAILVRKWAGRRIPIVVTVHGADLYAWKARIFTSLKRFIIHRAQVLTIVSEAMRADVSNLGARPCRIKLAPMGVDLRDRFALGTEQDRDACGILFVGRLVEKKGLRHLISAMPEIRAAGFEATLTVVGFGPEERDCKAQVDSLGLGGIVRFVGAIPQSELAAFYQRATVCVVPFVEAKSGDRDGLGLVAVEAAGCGCPVVISDLPAVHDIFLRNEATFVPPGDARLLAEAIKGVLGDLANAPRAPRSKLVDRFDWQAAVERYKNVFVEVLGCTPR